MPEESLIFWAEEYALNRLHQALPQTLSRLHRRHRHGRRGRRLDSRLAPRRGRAFSIRHAGGRHRVFSRCRRDLCPAASSLAMRLLSRAHRKAPRARLGGGARHRDALRRGRALRRHPRRLGGGRAAASRARRRSGCRDEDAPELAHAGTIAQAFGGETVEAILAALDDSAAKGTAFAAEAAAEMRAKSPTSLKVTLSALRRGA